MKSHLSLQQNLDSLVDIVSNNLGILIILAVFMAMLGLASPLAKQMPTEEDRLPPTLKIPWSHDTTKNPVLFLVRDNRVVHVDMARFFIELAKVPGRPGPLTLEQPNAKVRFFPVNNRMYCLDFEILPRAGEGAEAMALPGSDWEKIRSRYDKKGFYYFFWVTGDSFELFRKIRDNLWKEQTEVGWKPVLPKEKLEMCNGFENSDEFKPQ